jgi:hypothetical protein
MRNIKNNVLIKTYDAFPTVVPGSPKSSSLSKALVRGCPSLVKLF